MTPFYVHGVNSENLIIFNQVRFDIEKKENVNLTKEEYEDLGVFDSSKYSKEEL